VFPYISCALIKGESVNNKVRVVIEKDENGYYAFAPELEGCQTQGDTFEEVFANIQKAIDLYLETIGMRFKEFA
jgi:predicted RNase H-like HicB family nuclease